MTACPAGHDSVATDYCDVCGRRMDMAANQATPAPITPAQATAPDVTAPQPPGQDAQLCPRCGASRSGRFCEGCGLDLDAPLPPAASAEVPAASAGVAAASAEAPASSAGVPAPSAGVQAAPPGPGGDRAGTAWSVIATADRAYYDEVSASGGPDAALVTFPAYCPERRFVLTGQEMRIGRRSASRGLTPEIDLTGPPLDPGISRLHAVLIANPDLSWSVIDPGSENGTIVNGKEIVPGVPVPLHDGDRIHLGAWTLITVGQENSGQG